MKNLAFKNRVQHNKRKAAKTIKRFKDIMRLHVSIQCTDIDSHWWLDYKGSIVYNFVGSEEGKLSQVKEVLEHEDTILILNHIDSKVLILNKMEEAGIKPKYIV